MTATDYKSAEDLLKKIANLLDYIELAGRVGRGTGQERSDFVRAAQAGVRSLVEGRFGIDLADGIMKQAEGYRANRRSGSCPSAIKPMSNATREG